LVFDEADRMLTEESFRPELDVILNAIPKERQTLLFSATMVEDYDKLLSKELIYGNKNAKVVEIGNNKEADQEFQKTVQGLDQKFAIVPDNVKKPILFMLLKKSN
jgi:ATP-dependent RNA helicase DDX49/DBP8